MTMKQFEQLELDHKASNEFWTRLPADGKFPPELLGYSVMVPVQDRHRFAHYVVSENTPKSIKAYHVIEIPPRFIEEEIWFPKNGDKVFYKDSVGKTVGFIFDHYLDFHRELFEFGNLFKTSEECDSVHTDDLQEIYKRAKKGCVE